MLYVGGYFTNISGININYICEWNGSNYKQLKCGLNAPPTKIISNLEGIIFVGGTFISAGGCSLNYITKWQNNKWLPIDRGVNSNVLSLECDNLGHIYIGGKFYKKLKNGENMRVRISKWIWN